MEMKGSRQSGSRPRSKLWPAKALLVLIPLGMVVTFLALFKAATVNYLGSLEGWYALLSVVLALITLQVGALALQAVAERTEAGLLLFIRGPQTAQAASCCEAAISPHKEARVSGRDERQA